MIVDSGGPNTVLLFGFLRQSSCFLHFEKSIPRETLLLMLLHCGLFLSKIMNMIDYKGIKNWNVLYCNFWQFVLPLKCWQILMADWALLHFREVTILYTYCSKTNCKTYEQRMITSDNLLVSYKLRCIIFKTTLQYGPVATPIKMWLHIFFCSYIWSDLIRALPPEVRLAAKFSGRAKKDPALTNPVFYPIQPHLPVFLTPL